MDKRKIAIFDSGVGGLTTLEYLKRILPNEDYIYYGDFTNNPYGTKSTEELQSILKRNIEYLSSLDAKIIVIACNTAGTQIDYLKKLTSLPLLEPITVTTNNVKQIPNINSVLVLATEYTIKIKVYEHKLSEYKTIGCPTQELVSMAEGGRREQEVIDKLVGKYHKQFDVVILGCTHFGYFTEEIQKAVNPKMIVESSYELAKETKKYLTDNDLLNLSGNSQVTFIDKI